MFQLKCMNKTLIKIAQFGLFAQQQDGDNLKLFIMPSPKGRPLQECPLPWTVCMYVCMFQWS